MVSHLQVFPAAIVLPEQRVRSGQSDRVTNVRCLACTFNRNFSLQIYLHCAYNGGMEIEGWNFFIFFLVFLVVSLGASLLAYYLGNQD